MAHEPACWLLDENRKDTGKRDFTRCRPECCSVICKEVRPWPSFSGDAAIVVHDFPISMTSFCTPRIRTAFERDLEAEIIG